MRGTGTMKRRSGALGEHALPRKGFGASQRHGAVEDARRQSAVATRVVDPQEFRCGQRTLHKHRRATTSGLADFGPGVDEFDDFVGIGVVLAKVGDGVEEERADDDVGAVIGVGLFFLVGGVGELLSAVEDADGAAGLDVFAEPIGVMGVIPAGNAVTAGFAGGLGVLGGAGPNEAMAVAGFEVEIRDIAVGDLFVEPVADGLELPAVVEFLVDLLADVGGETGDAAAA
jgi:hypothetical protein